MKRVALFLLACLLLFSACGQVKPEPTTETTTASTEETTTEAFVLDNGESGEITWRTLDLNSAEGREAQKWLAERWEERMSEAKSEFPMGEGKTVVVRRGNSGDTLILRNKTGKETVLLEKTYIGEATTPEEALIDEVAWKKPVFAQVLDDRYFVYYWVGWEWAGETGIYDTQNMRTIMIEWDEKYNRYDGDWRFRFSGPQIIGDALYLSDASHGPYGGDIHLMRVDLKALNTAQDGEPLMAVDVLADIPGVQDVTDMNTRFVTKDERYFVLNDIAGLRVYDLQQKKLALQLPVSLSGFGEDESYWRPDQVILRGNKAYWTNGGDGTGKYLAEITLP